MKRVHQRLVRWECRLRARAGIAYDHCARVATASEADSFEDLVVTTYAIAGRHAVQAERCLAASRYLGAACALWRTRRAVRLLERLAVALEMAEGKR